MPDWTMRVTSFGQSVMKPIKKRQKANYTATELNIAPRVDKLQKRKNLEVNQKTWWKKFCKIYKKVDAFQGRIIYQTI